MSAMGRKRTFAEGGPATSATAGLRLARQLLILLPMVDLIAVRRNARKSSAGGRVRAWGPFGPARLPRS